VQEGLRLAGLRDHADEEADFAVEPVDILHADLFARTPTKMPGGRTIRTTELATLLSKVQPLLIDVALDSWAARCPARLDCRARAMELRFPKGFRRGSFARSVT
jgi:hypothetical protein